MWERLSPLACVADNMKHSVQRDVDDDYYYYCIELELIISKTQKTNIFGIWSQLSVTSMLNLSYLFILIVFGHVSSQSPK